MKPFRGMSTPWGRADSVEDLPHGCAWVGTPSHGGLYVPRELDETLPAEARACATAPGWYEEDCAYMVALYCLPEVAEASRIAAAPWNDGAHYLCPVAYRVSLAEAVCAWYGPDVARAVGIVELERYEARLRFWAENQARWGRKGRVAA